MNRIAHKHTFESINGVSVWIDHFGLALAASIQYNDHKYLQSRSCRVKKDRKENTRNSIRCVFNKQGADTHS